MNRNAKAFVDAATELFGACAIVNRDQIQRVVDEKAVPYPYWFVTRADYRVDRGQYRLPATPDGSQAPIQTVQVTPEAQPEAAVVNMAATVTVLRQKKLHDDADLAIPEKFVGYVPFGFFKDLVKILGTEDFYPVFITGMSGNGKTLMVEQACAYLKRECLRVNVSVETDESDLIGSNTLVDGNIVYRDGPVITAMKRGSVLLIDEVDRGSNKLMCMQGILEGKPYFNKKSGEYVHPAKGFNIIATANTKGFGSEDGKFLAQILDSAFLERFCITVEQEFPDNKNELKILKPLINDDEFSENLVRWADIVRKTYADGGVDEIISTRRLVHIAKTFKIFNDREKSINLCVSRFDEETKNSFIDLYRKIDVKVAEAPPVSVTPAPDVEIPF